jgi:hypothetical protein
VAPASLWVVVPTRQFLEPVRHHVVPRPQRTALPLPPRTGPRAGPAVGFVERATGRSVRPLAINDGATPSSARAVGGSVIFYRPRTAPVAAPPRATPGGASQGPRVNPPSRPPGYGVAPSPAAQRPQGISGPPAQQAPKAAPGPAPEAVAPRPAPSAEQAPRASAPRGSSNAEQLQAKER